MDLYVQLASNTIDHYIRKREVYKPSAEELTPEMASSRAGAFVSIHEKGELRGCIGTIAPTKQTLADEIVSNAIAASTRDPRFLPIREDELDLLGISVDVLGEAELIGACFSRTLKEWIRWTIRSPSRREKRGSESMRRACVCTVLR